MWKLRLISASVTALAGVSAHAVLPPVPSEKPPLIFASKVVSTQDAATVRLALQAADDGDWREVVRLEQQARDAAVSNLILWLRATQEPSPSFDMLQTALGRLEGWPRLGSIAARAEDAIAGSTLTPGQRVTWLEGVGPRTGNGKIALALAYISTGDREKAAAAIRDAWRNSSLTPDRRRLVLRDYRAFLTQDDHRARADFLVWSRQLSEARSLKTYLTDDWRALIEARVALARRERGVDDKVRAVPDTLQDHPGLLFERARWRRRAGFTDSVAELLIPIDGSQVPLAGRGRLWDERHLVLRRAMKDGDFDTAYRLAQPHGLNSGVDFASAEWTAGWLALRRTGDAEQALEHFLRLEDGVSTPISLSRARYWAGRAFEELSDEGAAANAFGSAAEFPYTYYGQLGAEKTGEPSFSLPAGNLVINTEETETFERQQLVRVARLLGEAGESSLFRTFVLHIDETLETEEQHSLLFRLAVEYQMPHVGLRGAKSGLAKGVVASDAAYPLLTIQPLRTARVEQALVLALSRQESELNPRAISSANARGLMQLLPSTARRQAALEGLPFRTSWLTDDPSYNITLGSAHLDDLLDQFGGSYILTIAAYNAGASRPKRWVTEYGDPRSRLVDPIDWVETIPFSETRNYVQRVMENLQVYRQRLTGTPIDIRLSEDLRRGSR